MLFLPFAMYSSCVIKILLILNFCDQSISNKIVYPDDWKTIELLAEQHPYLVAILNQAMEYVCTGIILDQRTVLTTGGCVSPDPYFVAVGTAVLGSTINNNSIFKVAYAKLHGDYVFEVQDSDSNISRMHSNIGLIFTVRPILDFFVEGATIGNYYASELKDKKLTMIGYGNIKTSDALVLQYQTYHQVACKNPKWYYCVCGIEYADISYDEPFGEGAPVIYDDEVVGVAVSPTGSLILELNIHYNVFTDLGPYISWIEKSKSDSVIQFRTGLTSANQKLYDIETRVYILIVFIKMFICYTVFIC